MNILIVGSGGREHAIAAAFSRSPKHPELFCCGPSLNPGIRALTQDYWVGDITDVAQIVQKAKTWAITVAIIGPEAPLEKGLADALAGDMAVIGPKKALALIETSKLFARDLMQKYQIAGLPRFQVFTDLNKVQSFLEELGENQYVIKANGLMGGKGVKVGGEHLHSYAEALAFAQEIFNQGQPVLIEEKLIGHEFSLMGFCDGEHIVPMPVVQDHKRAFVGDKGPNTGGMGSYSDANHCLPFLSKKDVETAQAINEAVLHALCTEQKDKYIGILYGSFIATRKGIYVIEFNARFGDPEALNVLSILESDFVALCEAMVKGRLSRELVRFAELATVCKYAVPQGYPDKSIQKALIDTSAVLDPAYLYFASVQATHDELYTLGSRTVAYVGVASDLAQAEKIAESEIQAIKGPLFHREDIGSRPLIEAKVMDRASWDT